MSQDQKQDLRREVIIEAAIKRFAHFGVGKTTMTEIGNDLSLSKASLYYYFPDKLSLYAAVLRTITQQTEKKDDEWLQKESDPKKAILLFLDMRTDFIIKYHNILEYLRNYTPATIPPPLDSIFVHLRHRELRRITDIIEKGRTSGQFSIENSEKVAELFFDFLDGFRHTVFSRNGTVFPDKKQFQSILKKEKEFVTIFFNGLSV